MTGIDPAILRFADRSARRFTELAECDAPAILLHQEAAVLVGLLAKVMRQCAVPETGDAEGDDDAEGAGPMLCGEITVSAYRAFVASKTGAVPPTDSWPRFEDLTKPTRVAWEAAVRQALDCARLGAGDPVPDEGRWAGWAPPDRGEGADRC